MAFDYRFPTLSAVALMMAAPAAQAELTSSDVWSDWKAYMSSFGYEMSGIESASGNGLTIDGMKMRMELPEGEGQISVDMGTTQFVDQPDGSVRIEMSENWVIGFDLRPADAETVSGQLLYSQSESDFVVSGDPSAMSYLFSVASANFKMDDLKVDGKSVGSDIFGMNVTMADTVSSSKMTVADQRTVTQTVTVGATTYDFKAKDPEGSGLIEMQGTINSLEFKGDTVIPMIADFNNMPKMLNAGFALVGGYTFAGGSTAITFDGPDGSGTMNTASEGGSLDLTMSEDGLAYSTTANAFTVNALMNQLPIPISFEADRATFNIGMPMLKGDEPQDFAFGTAFEGFQMSDTLWGLFDPTSQLPRDPATVIFDLTGTAKVLFDFLDPAQAAVLEQSGAAPGELNSVDLKNLTVDAVGARLTGSGAFTFDNSDTQTFGGMPRPNGSVDLQLQGGNGLIDKLSGMGLLPQEQAMGARMMLGIFARPGEGEDSLVSKIEINEQGHVLANGQRLQ